MSDEPQGDALLEQMVARLQEQNERLTQQNDQLRRESQQGQGLAQLASALNNLQQFGTHLALSSQNHGQVAGTLMQILTTLKAGEDRERIRLAYEGRMADAMETIAEALTPPEPEKDR